MDERLDVLDEAGEPTGEVAWKSEAHRLGLPHRCFHCWVASRGSDSDGPYLLVQRRAATKDTWPGRLDVSAAGHLRSGEEVIRGGLRELEEELGLRVEPARLIPLGSRRVDQEIPGTPGGRDREFHEVFLLLDDTLPEELRLQREEVESVLRLGLDDAEALGEGRSAPAEEWRDGERTDVRVRPSDFVPNNDDAYLRQVAWAAREALAGNEPGCVFAP